MVWWCKSKSWNYINLIFVITSTFISFYIGSINITADIEVNLAYIFTCGIIAASAMIIPGISGALILVILGLYSTMINAVNNCYSYEYSNIHRGVYELSAKLTQKFEDSRLKIAEFISAPSSENIVFTKSATESINLVAQTFCEKYMKKGAETVEEGLPGWFGSFADMITLLIALEKMFMILIF